MIAIERLIFVLKHTLVGCVVAGLYGVLHDQITYLISPEYFTKFKFVQFGLTETRQPDFVTVGVIGWMATWWVGFFCTLILAILAGFLMPMKTACRRMNEALGILLASALAAGIAGGLLGYARREDQDFANWQYYSTGLGVQDLPAFVNVGYIHNASYLGGLIGLTLAVAYLIGRRVLGR